MSKNSVWKRAQTVKLELSEEVLPEFSLWFDKRIPEELKNELLAFVVWVEENYSIPITLQVNFEYKHYLISRKGKRVGYLFYWHDFTAYPAFGSEDSFPLINLPVRTERSTIEEILTSFLDAISNYFAWICNEPLKEYTPDYGEVDEILKKYLSSKRG